MQIDKVDIQILDCLTRHGRMTHQAIGEAIGRSPTAIARRQRALEEQGIVIRYAAQLDFAKLGFGTTVYIKIALSSQRREELTAFEEAVARCPSVVRCHLMSGSDDYLVMVQVRSLDHFAQVHRDELSSLPCVARMESGFTLKEVVPARLPLNWSDAVVRTGT